MHDPVEKRPAYFHKVHPRVYTRPLLSISPCFLLLRGKGKEGTKLPLNDFYTTMVIFKPINSRLRINHFLLPMKVVPTFIPIFSPDREFYIVHANGGSHLVSPRLFAPSTVLDIKFFKFS